MTMAMLVLVLVPSSRAKIKKNIIYKVRGMNLVYGGPSFNL
jgi:hypothetical protein